MRGASNAARYLRLLPFHMENVQKIKEVKIGKISSGKYMSIAVAAST